MRDTLESGWIGLGPRTLAFEDAFALHVGASHCVAVNSGTAAFHLAMLALRLPPDAEVVVPALTFVSTAHAVLLAGAHIVFADVDPQTLNLDPDDLERRLSPRTRAIVPVHYGGSPCAMNEITALARARGAAVVEDAAHAAGAAYGGRKVGALSALTCFSFHGVKNMTTGDGGCVTTGSAEHAAHLRRLRWMGIDRDTWHRTGGTPAALEYEVTDLGFKYQMNDIAAAIGLVQLAKLERMNEPAAGSWRRATTRRSPRSAGCRFRRSCRTSCPRATTTRSSSTGATSSGPGSASAASPRACTTCRSTSTRSTAAPEARCPRPSAPGAGCCSSRSTRTSRTTSTSRSFAPSRTLASDAPDHSHPRGRCLLSSGQRTARGSRPPSS